MKKASLLVVVVAEFGYLCDYRSALFIYAGDFSSVLWRRFLVWRGRFSLLDSHGDKNALRPVSMRIARKRNNLFGWSGGLCLRPFVINASLSHVEPLIFFRKRTDRRAFLGALW